MTISNNLLQAILRDILPAILSCWVCVSVFEEQLIVCRYPVLSEFDDSIINEDVRRLVMESGATVGFVGIGSLPVRIARTPYCPDTTRVVLTLSS